MGFSFGFIVGTGSSTDSILTEYHIALKHMSQYQCEGQWLVPFR
jgi:hypothetical protein